MSAYQTVLDILKPVAEEPRETALQILEALRETPPEVARAGIDHAQWIVACNAMISAANDVGEALRSAEAKARSAQFPAMKARLEQHGCEVTHRADQVWNVRGPGLSIDLDLHAGGVVHADGDVGEQLPGFDQMEDFIILSVTRRRGRDAD